MIEIVAILVAGVVLLAILDEGDGVLSNIVRSWGRSNQNAATAEKVTELEGRVETLEAALLDQDPLAKQIEALGRQRPETVELGAANEIPEEMTR